MKNSTIERVNDLCTDLELPAPDNFVFVDIESQTLTHYKSAEEEATYKVSTSKFGTGSREGSYKTPLGLHCIEEKIGQEARPWTIFSSREDTGVVWEAGMDGENQVLTRILRLRGLEEGVNAGDGIDSYERYIYIHGTNNEETIGTPMSHGCICMKNDDIITLYNTVEAGTYVYVG
ncbi:MAG: L,D-transpeptidase [Chitinispirillales bacterium]|jgi:hypothetical protein|nr:L,D-transpeptidase [Chitinispirillales bacterium]